MGGWAPRTINVALPVKLRKLAGGVKVVTCRYLGGGQIERIATAKAMRVMDRMANAGPAFLSAIEGKARDTTQKTSSEDEALSEYPPDLVCRRVVRELDAEPVSEQVEAWVEDTHPDVLRHVALAVIRASDLIPETEKAAGEGSGGSPAS